MSYKLFTKIAIMFTISISAKSQTPYNYIYHQDSSIVIQQILYQDTENVYTFNYRNYFEYQSTGFVIQKTNKRTGKNSKLSSFYLPNNWLLNSWKPILPLGDKMVLLPLLGRFGIYAVEVDFESSKIQLVDTLRYPDDTSLLYPTDVMQIGDTIVYLSGVSAPSINTTYRSITYRTPTYQKIISIPNDNPLYEYDTGRFFRLDNGNFILFGGRLKGNLQSINITCTEVDRSGAIIEQFVCPDAEMSGKVYDALKISNDEYILLCLSTTGPPSSSETKYFHTVYRYNHKTKKIVWRHRITKGITYEFVGRSSIIAGHRPDEYLYASTASADPSGQDTTYSEGRIIKLKGNGSVIWAKSYAYFAGNGEKNEFYDIIASDSSHYFAGGTSTNESFNAWLIKIDEDGNIVPTDSTSGTHELDISIPDIKIYPNPASDILIINQGEITDITYTIIDIQGRTIKHMHIDRAHHNTIWDISDVPQGIYFLSITHAGRLLDSRQIVVE